ncbi:IS1 family transposase, partial [Citrobacter freundii]|uniref:IS1 family transposase n=4 Tax=Enterobacteriaceae TaxID=543 RepID=UPI003879A628
MASISIRCPSCSATEGVVRNGKSTAGHQRYLCSHCRKTWQLQFTYTASQPGTHQKIIDMAMNGVGCRASARIMGGTVAKLAMRQPFVLFKGLTFQKLCLPGAFRPGDHHNKMLRP